MDIRRELLRGLEFLEVLGLLYLGHYLLVGVALVVLLQHAISFLQL